MSGTPINGFQPARLVQSTTAGAGMRRAGRVAAVGLGIGAGVAVAMNTDQETTRTVRNITGALAGVALVTAAAKRLGKEPASRQVLNLGLLLGGTAIAGDIASRVDPVPSSGDRFAAAESGPRTWAPELRRAYREHKPGPGTYAVGSLAAVGVGTGTYFAGRALRSTSRPLPHVAPVAVAAGLGAALGVAVLMSDPFGSAPALPSIGESRLPAPAPVSSVADAIDAIEVGLGNSVEAPEIPPGDWVMTFTNDSEVRVGQPVPGVVGASVPDAIALLETKLAAYADRSVPAQFVVLAQDGIVRVQVMDDSRVGGAFSDPGKEDIRLESYHSMLRGVITTEDNETWIYTQLEASDAQDGKLRREQVSSSNNRMTGSGVVPAEHPDVVSLDVPEGLVSGPQTGRTAATVVMDGSDTEIKLGESLGGLGSFTTLEDALAVAGSITRDVAVVRAGEAFQLYLLDGVPSEQYGAPDPSKVRGLQVPPAADLIEAIAVGGDVFGQADEWWSTGRTSD